MDRYSYQRVSLSLEDDVVNKRFELAGQRITHNDGTSPIKIKLNSNTNDEIDIDPNGSTIVPEGFDRIFVSADKSAGNTVEFIVSSPASMEFDNKALTIGTIASVTQNDVLKKLERDESNWYDTLNNKNTFVGGAVVAGVASEYSMVALYNPSASGKNIIAKVAKGGSISTGGEYQMNLRYLAGTTGFTKSMDGVNKYIGDSVGVGDIYVSDNASLLGTFITTVPCTVSGYFDLIDGDFYLVPPNYSLIVAIVDTGKTFASHFEWLEVDA